MEAPKEKTKEEILKLYHKRVFYHLNNVAKYAQYTIEPCIIIDITNYIRCKKPVIRYFDNDMKPENSTTVATWESLYDGWEEANKAAKHIKRLYTEGFYRPPYVTIDVLENYKFNMMVIENRINLALKDYPNFLGIDFCDVGESGIQIRGHHKAFSNYSYGEQPTIKYNFSNDEAAAKEFIEMWKKEDTPSQVARFKKFVEFGEKYGWD